MAIKTYFDQDNFDTRRSNSPSAGNGFDPESLITGAELAAGFTYTNSRRDYPGQATYDAIVAGDIPADAVPLIAPRVSIYVDVPDVVPHHLGSLDIRTGAIYGREERSI